MTANQLSATLDAAITENIALRAENEALHAYNKDLNDNLALANAEIKNLRMWNDVQSNMLASLDEQGREAA